MPPQGSVGNPLVGISIVDSKTMRVLVTVPFRISWKRPTEMLSTEEALREEIKKLAHDDLDRVMDRLIDRYLSGEETSSG